MAINKWQFPVAQAMILESPLTPLCLLYPSIQMIMLSYWFYLQNRSRSNHFSFPSSPHSWSKQLSTMVWFIEVALFWSSCFTVTPYGLLSKEQTVWSFENLMFFCLKLSSILPYIPNKGPWRSFKVSQALPTPSHRSLWLHLLGVSPLTSFSHIDLPALPPSWKYSW